MKGCDNYKYLSTDTKRDHGSNLGEINKFVVSWEGLIDSAYFSGVLKSKVVKVLWCQGSP